MEKKSVISKVAEIVILNPPKGDLLSENVIGYAVPLRSPWPRYPNTESLLHTRYIRSLPSPYLCRP
jgi:hypothetical protein